MPKSRPRNKWKTVILWQFPSRSSSPKEACNSRSYYWSQNWNETFWTTSQHELLDPEHKSKTIPKGHLKVVGVWGWGSGWGCEEVWKGMRRCEEVQEGRVRSVTAPCVWAVCLTYVSFVCAFRACSDSGRMFTTTYKVSEAA